MKAFQKYGFVMILMSRAAPILPEVSACLAGMTRMRIRTFFVAWSINTIKGNPALKQETIAFWKNNERFSNPITLNEAIGSSSE